jgi:DNA-binding CsgD family transcriptional regulator
LAASYGAFLRGNSADILYQLGRWREAEAECRIALEWRMSALEAEWWPPLVLGLLLTESRGDAEAERLVGQAMLQLETVPPGQWTGHVLRSAISVALWSGDADGALSIAEREWPRALESDELAVVAWAASTCLEAAAAAVDHGRESSDTGLIVRARILADRVLPEATAHISRSSVGPGLGARQEAELHLATAHAHAQRVRGGVDPVIWDELATAWGKRPMPYLEAMARRWQALAILAAALEDDREGARIAARWPLAEAYRIARDLPALPLLREVVDFAARARVALPITAGAAAAAVAAVQARMAGDAEALATGATVGSSGGHELVAVGPGPRPAVAVGPGRPDPVGPTTGSDIAREIEERVIAALRRRPADAYGLSPREQEVLDVLAQGRTDRDIAARLFISERTVHVHVRRILSKLHVSSRTEAAGLAIRQGLVPAELPDRQAASRHAPGERMT